ncbi:DUF3097 domain-containing protein [Aeromicrobium sp.]|uniref:DUF3097 domain-containing protein n=1 Tax=Aeromicrobium sp. TaxID=1871063 RepID=UPI0025BE91EB|nr:DUF3097 domain-containing protein [Aeromicrobium sp.]MCK5892476.1 DUF3097 domain-containing protein [Aeromicrobium sp.]
MALMSDRYGQDVLSGDWKRPSQGRSADLPVELGLVVEDVTSGFVGEIVTIDAQMGMVVLEDRRHQRRSFALGPGYWVDGKPVTLRPPVVASAGPRRTASGSVAGPRERAKVAQPSRIWVEGRHDAELVEKVWGDDLRHVGVAVEYLGGIDDLKAEVDSFDPGPGRRLGVLVDHLVTGSKEWRIAQTLSKEPHVLVVGHPYVDVWQTVKPARLGLQEWPVIPRGVEWKHGICEALGWPHAEQADIARAWKKILGAVETWTDLEPVFLGRVEELIDFVTADGPA